MGRRPRGMKKPGSRPSRHRRKHSMVTEGRLPSMCPIVRQWGQLDCRAHSTSAPNSKNHSTPRLWIDPRTKIPRAGLPSNRSDASPIAPSKSKKCFSSKSSFSNPTNKFCARTDRRPRRGEIDIGNSRRIRSRIPRHHRDAPTPGKQRA